MSVQLEGVDSSWNAKEHLGRRTRKKAESGEWEESRERCPPGRTWLLHKGTHSSHGYLHRSSQLNSSIKMGRNPRPHPPVEGLMVS